MNYTEIINALQAASLFDLFRLSVAIRHEMENPARIKEIRNAFKEGDTISYFDGATNTLRSGVVLQKNIKYVSIVDTEDKRHWKITYPLINLGNVKTNIHASPSEKLSKNNLKVGDCVGFNHDGKQITGIVTRLNYKTISLITADQCRWRASYSCLYKIIDADLAKRVTELDVNS